MQNYLQTANKKRIKLLPAMAFVFLLTAVLLLACFKSSVFSKILGNKNTEAYSSSMFTSIAEDTKAYFASSDENLMKMNNENAKNAKSEDEIAKKLLYETDFSMILVKFDGKIQKMPLEEYVVGCVLGEMPSGFELEALMAQSVAVRTFAVRGGKHSDADVCTDYSCCQSYHDPESVDEQTLSKVKSAVNATKGIIATYEGQPILAAYHSSSGEKTLSSKEVWGGDLPYLVSTPSPKGETAVSAFGGGHRVGMSQHGANLLAKEGKTFAEILKYYYKGIDLTFVKTM